MNEGSGGNGVAFRTSYYSTDCRNRKSRLREGVAHDSTGKVIFRRSYGDNGPLMQVIPDTIGEEIFKAVCFR